MKDKEKYDWVPFIAGVVSVIATFLVVMLCIKLAWEMNLIITLCVGTTITTLAQSIREPKRERYLRQKCEKIEETTEQLKENIATLINLAEHNSQNVNNILCELDCIVNEIKEIKVVKELNSIAKYGKHPYFQKTAKRIWDNIIGQYSGFFRGTFITSPKSDFTFGVSGISCTQKTLEATSVVSDYWEGGFVEEYLKTHEELIKRNVRIQRIFILSEGRFDILKDMMKRQSDIGIDVRYIFSSDKFVAPEWLSEDYLIQDGKLLVQISCSSHISNEDNTELITLDKTMVNTMIGHYHKLLEYTSKFKE